MLITLMLIVATVGCGGEEFAPTAGTESSVAKSQTKGNGIKKATFTINGTDFGIDLVESSFVDDTSDPPEHLLTIEIRGDKEKFDKLDEDPDSEWSWASYAPHFYIRDFPGEKRFGSSVVVANASLGNSNYYEVAIYMMNHNDIDDVKIELDPDKSLKITGRVDLFGEMHDFEIDWTK